MWIGDCLRLSALKWVECLDVAPMEKRDELVLRIQKKLIHSSNLTEFNPSGSKIERFEKIAGTHVRAPATASIDWPSH